VTTPRRTTVETTSRLPAGAEKVWTRVVTAEGINDELRPLLRMTVPRPVRGVTLDDVELGVKVCRSWILLGGVLPVEYDDIVIAERETGRRFRETSSMLTMRSWEHERTVTRVGEECELTDRVTFELRRTLAAVPTLHGLVERVVRALFAHRHRRVARHFSNVASPAVAGAA
jgi:ligand-binding SRPBCC domain-containing protein